MKKLLPDRCIIVYRSLPHNMVVERFKVTMINLANTQIWKPDFLRK